MCSNSVGRVVAPNKPPRFITGHSDDASHGRGASVPPEQRGGGVARATSERGGELVPPWCPPGLKTRDCRRSYAAPDLRRNHPAHRTARLRNEKVRGSNPLSSTHDRPPVP
ncbi:hypothetical protein CCE01nite_36650 [Cellulomonas cellasea]|uniref:Uncharacterized protein n=1 Tax=Cellulomonas cellasea TaxID=43670 RepID=A0A4Y3L225_9CELL|nr:hypothetical protein CCE01nite_36650 [Cellulomonas cellasea]